MTAPTLAQYRQWLALDQARARHFATRLRLSGGRAADEDRLLASYSAACRRARRWAERIQAATGGAQVPA